ncbi:TRIC cation channel family protein [Bilophila wadsworthia]|uniref:TRIC cation channel family protein n=1 Tax=Bilophila wadsworthia TaxID=35833 RepID=UPI003AB77E3F
MFTAVGVSTGWTAGYHDNMFFLSFLGVLTGVGGGLLRDVMAHRFLAVLRRSPP